MQLPGISTGIDTATMVTQLMAVSKQRLYSYKIQQGKYAERNTALGELRGKLNAFNSSLDALSEYDSLLGFKATSSDKDVLNATAASSGVYEGTHEIEVNQLANSERWVHSGFLFEASLVGAGKFIYSYNHEEIVIDTDAETTLSDLAGLINNDVNNPGVTATILEYDDGNEGVFHLMLSGNDAGTDYQITINSSTTQVLAADITLEKDGADASLTTKLVDLDQFSGLLRGDEIINITGKDHLDVAITQKDLDLTAEMNVGHLIDRINDAFDGVAKAKFEDGRITLTDDVSGYDKTSMTLTLSGGGGAEPAALILPTFSTTVADGGTVGNELPGTNVLLNTGSFTKTQAAQDSQVRVDGYPANEIQTLSAATSPDGGKFDLTYDGETVIDIDYDATAQEIQDALETLTNVNAGDITVSGSLDAGDVKFTFASTIGDASMISINSAALTGGSGYTVEETASAWMTSSSNSLSNALPGVSMELYDVGTVQITLNKDTDSIKTKLKGLVTSYNSVINFIKDKSTYNAETNSAGVLMSSYTTRAIKTLMRTGMRAQAEGFTDGEEEYIYAYEIGLDYSNKQDKLGTLELDETMLDEAIENNYEAVAALLGISNAGRSSGTDKDIIKFNDSSQYTKAGDYEVEVVTDASGDIQEVKVRHSSDGTWHSQPDTSWTSKGVVTIEGKESDEGDWYPERDLQINIDISALGLSQTYTATVHVKQGVADSLKDRLQDVLDTSTTGIDDRMVPNGYLAIDMESGESAIEALNDRIAQEEKRLDLKEDRLTAQFARLEKTMTILQQQFSALTMLQQQA